MAGKGRAPPGRPGQCTRGIQARSVPAPALVTCFYNPAATLADFDPGLVDMHTLVVVGSSRTRVQGGRMVTPRDYRWAPQEEI